MSGIPENIIAILGVDNAGAITNIDPSLLFNKKEEVAKVVIQEPAPQKEKAAVAPVVNTVESVVALTIDAQTTNIPMVNKDQTNLENSVVWQVARKVGINTKNPRWLLDLFGGSLNVTPSTVKDGYRIKNINFAYADFAVPAKEQLIFGDDTYLPIVNVNDFIIRGLIPVTGTGIDRILFINDLGEVTAKTDIFIESINGITKKIQTFTNGASGTTPNFVSTISGTTGVHTLNIPLAQSSGVTAGLISKAEYDIFNGKQNALGFTPENIANKGAVGGYASLDSTGKVPSSQLPSFVDSVLEYANLAAFPATGVSGTIYVAIDTNKTYRWGGSSYVEIGATGVAWGAISGTLSSQGDLQTALNAKQNLITAAALTKVDDTNVTLTLGGSPTTALLAATSITVGWTGTLADARIASSSTWNAKQNALTAGAGISLVGATISSTITQYTDALARAAFSAGAGISLAGGVISYTGTIYTNSSIRNLFSAGSGMSYNSTTGVFTCTITQYADSNARNAISLTTSGTSGASTYNPTTGVLNIPVYQGGVTSFNSRTGAVTLTLTDVTSALGYTPYNGAINPNGYTSNAGTVTSVALTSSIGLSMTNSPITSSGTIVVGSINDDLRMRSLIVGTFSGLLLPTPVNGRIEASGDIVGYSTSDENFKENISVIKNAVETLRTIRGVRFNWDKEHHYIHGFEGEDIGVIAQDVQAQFPYLVRERENGFLAVRYEKLIGLLVAAVNEQTDRIKELEAKIK